MKVIFVSHQTNCQSTIIILFPYLIRLFFTTENGILFNDLLISLLNLPVNASFVYNKVSTVSIIYTLFVFFLYMLLMYRYIISNGQCVYICFRC